MATSKSLASLFLIGLLLTGCKTGAAITCPTLKQYSKTFLAEAGKEFEMIETKAPHVIQMITDYGVERDAIRKCIELRGKSRSVK